MFGIIVLIVVIVLVRKSMKKKKEKKLELERLQKAEAENTENKTIFVDISGKEDQGQTSFVWDDKPQEKSVVLEDTQNHKTFTLHMEEMITIGSSAELCDLQIDYDKTISRRHCMLLKRGAEYFIKDLNSTNGTFLNGSKVYFDERAIHHEDWIRLGKTEMQFLLK